MSMLPYEPSPFTREGEEYRLLQELHSNTLQLMANAEKENERLRKDLSARLQELHAIRNESLTWAMTCSCDCPNCIALYDVIKGSTGHPTGDG